MPATTKDHHEMKPGDLVSCVPYRPIPLDLCPVFYDMKTLEVLDVGVTTDAVLYADAGGNWVRDERPTWWKDSLFPVYFYIDAALAAIAARDKADNERHAAWLVQEDERRAFIADQWRKDHPWRSWLRSLVST